MMPAVLAIIPNAADITDDRKLNDLLKEAKREHDFAQASFSKSLEHAYNAGVALNELKGQTKHGSWLDLLHEIGIQPRTAQCYMRVAADIARENLSNFKTLESALEFASKERVARRAPKNEAPAHLDQEQERELPVLRITLGLTAVHRLMQDLHKLRLNGITITDFPAINGLYEQLRRVANPQQNHEGAHEKP
jgi:hypothetical protein